MEIPGLGCDLGGKSSELSFPSIIDSFSTQAAAMEPLSIVGGIVSIGEAAGAVAKCAHILYSISYKAGYLAEEIDLFASQVDVFGSIISSAHRTIRNHYMKDRTSTMIQKLYKSSTLDSLAFQTTCVIKRIENLQKRVNNHNGTPDFLARLLWLLKKEQRNHIYIWMDRIKLSFLLIMDQVVYEGYKWHALDPSTLDRELFDLKREM